MSKKTLILSLCFFSFLLACKKESIPTVLNDEFLTNKSWKMEGIKFTTDNILYHYKRNSSGNNIGFDKDIIRFKKDGTGTYTNNGSDIYNLSWKFLDAEKSKIEYTIFNYSMGHPEPGVNQVVDWENVVATTTSLKYAEIYTRTDDVSIVCSVERSPSDTELLGAVVKGQ
jgi:hypothetical protein